MFFPVLWFLATFDEQSAWHKYSSEGGNPQLERRRKGYSEAQKIRMNVVFFFSRGPQDQGGGVGEIGDHILDLVYITERIICKYSFGKT